MPKKQPETENILELITQCVVTTDLKGVVTYWNAASERIFGYSKKEVLNRSLKELYPAVAEKQFRVQLQQLKEGREIKGQWKSITKTGEVIWVDVHAKPVKDVEGNPTAILATAHDIGELKRVERELEENKAKAQTILETTVDGILTIDEEGTILSFNQAASKIFGYTEQEVLGENVTLLLPDPYPGENEMFMERYRGERKKNIVGRRRELTGKRKNGSLFPMELSVSEVKWNGNPIYTGVFNDISERRRLEKEILRISEEERRRLGQDLHDGLGQMLTGISLISRNLAGKLERKQVPGAEEVQEISDLIREADEYTKALAQGLVHINFEEEGLPTALGQLSNQAEKFFNINCSFNSNCTIKISNNIATHLYRIAQEAISNAVKHGRADNIHICLATEDGHIKLSVRDDGIGFEETTRGDKKKGMGIQIMKYRVNVMSGQLEISRSEDNKTSVECSIPVNSI